MELKPPNEYQTEIESWEKFLLSSPSSTLILFEGKEEDILTADLEIPNKRVINNDSERSRHKERLMYPDFADVLKRFLSHYCKTNNIIYKQGMNEIASPFLFLYYYTNLALPRAYNLFQSFLNLFLNNYYYHSEINAITISVSIVHLLLKYHEPAIYHIFQENSILPQAYSANWLLTAFGSKLKIHMVYSFWDIMIKEQNFLFPFYFTIALLKHNKNAIISSSKDDSVPNCINSISIETSNVLEKIYLEAKKIEGNTPRSFDLLVHKLRLFDPRCKMEELNRLGNVIKLNSMISLPIFPSEILKLIYPKKIFCINNSCDNFTSKEGKGCPICQSSSKKRINYVIIDLRQADQLQLKNRNHTLLPMTIFYNNVEYSNAHNNIVNHFIHYKERAHFAFITGSTEHFSEFELNLYQEKSMERKDIVIGTKPKIEKEVNQKKVNAFLAKDTENLTLNVQKFQEFDALKTILEALTTYQIPYASFVLGGFKEIHYMTQKQNISLINHNNATCVLCLNQLKQKVKEGSEIERLFSLNPENAIKPKKVFGELFELVVALYKGETYQIYSCNIVLIDNTTINQKGYFIMDHRKICIYKIIQSQFKSDLLSNKEEGEYVALTEKCNFNSITLIQRNALTKSRIAIEYEQKAIEIDFLLEEKANEFFTKYRAYNYNNHPKKALR